MRACKRFCRKIVFYYSPFWFTVVFIISSIQFTHCKGSSQYTVNRYKTVSLTQPSDNGYYSTRKYFKAVPRNQSADIRPIKMKIKRQSHVHKMVGHETKTHEKDVDTTLDDLLEVMGPHLFLIPFVLKALPFAIPALPLSYILSRYAPATIPELFTQLMEYVTQINESLMQGTAGGHEG